MGVVEVVRLLLRGWQLVGLVGIDPPADHGNRNADPGSVRAILIKGGEAVERCGPDAPAIDD